MLEFNIELAKTIQDGLKTLNLIHRYNPSYKINLKSLCLQKCDAQYNIDKWPHSLISDFLLSICKIEEHTVTELDELLQLFNDTGMIDQAFESFSLEYDYTEVKELENNPEHMEEFLSYIKNNYIITKYSLTSSFLYSKEEAIKDFLVFIPFILMDSLNLSGVEYLFDEFTLNDESLEATYSFYIDSSDEAADFEAFLSSEGKEKYLTYFENAINCINKTKK